MVNHQILLVVLLVGDVEQQSCLQRTLWPFECFPLRIVKLAQSIETASLVNEVLLVLSLPDELVVNLY